MKEYLLTLLTAAAPVAELRGSIPLALGIYGMPVATAFILSIVGNMIPVFFILWLLDPVQKFLSKNFKFMNRFFTWLFSWTRSRHAKKFERYEAFALILLVAIPLPMTGAWTGSLAAFVFGIPYKKALPLIFLGVLIAGTIVTLASTGVIKFFLIN
jgi:uncharacterized membrane protein